MNDLFYEMIFKRKSFHLFRNTDGAILQEELEEIQTVFSRMKPLIHDIDAAIEIVPADQTTCRRGEEYCILFYSEKKKNYLQNIGYLGEQMDLYLASKNIGALWFGIGKTEQPKYQNLDFVIMIAIARMPESKFRKDMFKSKRKPLEEVLYGADERGIFNTVRFAPSACNSQPWIVERHGDELSVYRYKKPGRRGIMPKDKVGYYNKIDMGIFLLFLDVCLKKEGISYEKEICMDDYDNDDEKVLNARYILNK